MFPKRFALISGIIMLAMGAFALIPQFVGSAEMLPILKVNDSYGMFLGYFPMNIFNKVALIALGLAGIYAATRPTTALPASIQFSRWTFYVMGALAILGQFPQTNTLSGYWPLFGNEVAFHALFAIMGAYFGFALTSKVKIDESPVRRTMSNKDMSNPLPRAR